LHIIISHLPTGSIFFLSGHTAAGNLPLSLFDSRLLYAYV
jgi:hypothetical protein